MYTRILAEMGYACVGVDFSPTSIEYARRQAAGNGLEVEYVLRDIREYRSERQFDCIIMTFGEFNVFTRRDAAAILGNCSGVLRENGLFVLETHTFEAVHACGTAPASWHAGGLFSDTPHILLWENIWDGADASALTRYFVVDAASAEVRRYSSFMQAYTAEQYRETLHAASLSPHEILGETVWPPGDYFRGKLQAFVCRKNGVSL